MNADLFADHWALILAIVPAAVALILVLKSLMSRTAGGQLRRVLGEYRKAEKAMELSTKRVAKAVRRVEKMTSNSGTVRPRLLQEAGEAAEDARALAKIASDKAQIAANHVRKVIHEEFPPAKQKRLRQKYLPQDEADGRPYTF